MSYRIELLPAARRQLRKLAPKAQKQVKELIDMLAENPRPTGYKVLKGDLKGLLRVRTGDFRVIYTIKDDLLLVIILKIGDRRSVY
jgi:mRNA interferase RelE/StbE